MLYANEDDWSSFETYADESTATSNAQANVLEYNSFTLRIICTITSIQSGDGCCIMDKSSTLGGGYCLVYDGSEVDTYFLTNAQMNTALTSTYAISSTYLIDTTSADNDMGFEYF